MKYFFLALLIPLFGSYSSHNEEYDVDKVYSAEMMPSTNITVLTSRGEIKELDDILDYEVDNVLTEMKLKPGNYEVQVSRKDANLYEVAFKDIYIKTRFCYEFGVRLDAILKVEQSYGYSSMKLIFTD